jgi:putative ABC transport system permease protein
MLLNYIRLSIRVADNMHGLFAPEFPQIHDHVNRHYTTEKIWRNQILFFTYLAIGIAFLGMLGMISNKASEKTKEIGIRKVLGAELHQVAQLLLSTTAKQIALAAVFGIQ